jgi:hypothetical protein
VVAVDPERTRFGLEIEYALAQPGRGFLDFASASFDEFGRIVDRLPDHHDPDLTRGDLAIKWTRWYVEGDERFAADGTFVNCAAKGIETRTPIQPSIRAAIAAATEQTALLATAAAADDHYLVTTGYNPVRDAYRPDPPFNPWEEAMRAAHPEYAAPEVYMLSYGPDINLSNPGWTDDDVIDIARKLTYYSAALASFSLNAPFAGGVRFDGYSARVHARAGRRPAARAFVAPECVPSPPDGGPAPDAASRLDAASRPNGGLGSNGGPRNDGDRGIPLPPFVVAARIPAERGRIEFKAFDPVPLPNYAGLLALVAGVALDARLMGRADQVDVAAHHDVARYGFDEADGRAAAADVLAAARDAVPPAWTRLLDPLVMALAGRRTPAHDAIDRHRHTGDLFPPGPIG